MLPSPIRWFATGAAVAVAAVLGFASVDLPAGAATSDAARRELLDRLGRGATATWGVTSRFHRETPAGPLDTTLEQLNRRPDWLTAGFGSVRGAWQGRTIECSNAPGGKLCGPSAVVDPALGTRSSAETLRAATGRRGATRVRRDGTIRAGGRRGRCFSLLPRSGRLRDRVVTQYCLTPGGIPLRVRIRRHDSSDVVTAERIRRRVTDADFTRLLRGYPIGPPA